MRYLVRALDRQQAVVSMVLEAGDEADVRSQLTAQGVTLLSVRQQRQGLESFRLSAGKFSVTLFSQELQALLEAGMSLVEAIEGLADKAEQHGSRKVLEDITRHLYQGKTFSQALSSFPAIFPPLYVATIRAAERTGAIIPALKRYIDYREQMDRLRRKIISASLYPVLLLIAGGLVTLFLLGYVVPRFAGIYEEAGRDLPWLSQLLLGWGRLIGEHGLIMLGAGLVLLGGVVSLFRSPALRRRLVERIWRLPVLGRRLKLYQLARFYRTAGMLLGGGMPILVSLEMSRNLLPAAMAAQLVQAAEDIRTGRPISWAMESHGLTTPISLRMLRVGEKTGRMDEMMERVAAFYDDDMARWVDWFTRLFEPLLMVFIGLVIGGIVVLMYMPVFELAGALE